MAAVIGRRGLSLSGINTPVFKRSTHDGLLLGGRKFGRGEAETVTVFGCTGFLGRYVVNQLGQAGCTVFVPFRGDDMEWRHLKLMGDLGQINPVPFNAKDKDSVKYAMKNSTAVINLIGKHYETKHIVPWWVNNTLHDVHVKAAQTIAESASELGIERLIHVSSLTADAASPSVWDQTKAEGEQAVLSAFPNATIVRPTTLFGAEDRFLVSIADTGSVAGRMFVVNGGTQKLQPVDVQDVATAIRQVIETPELDGSVLELAGPKVYELREVIQRVKDITEMVFPVQDLPVPVMQLLGRGMQNMPNPQLTEDQVVKMTMDNVLDPATDAVTFEKLGITPAVMESHAYDYLRMFRRVSKLSTA